MKMILAAIGVTLLGSTAAAAQPAGTGKSATSTTGAVTRREASPAARALRDRPFGSMGTGTVMGSTGTDSAMGTGGSIGTGTGHGTGIGTDTGVATDLGSTGYRFSPNASPTNPALDR
jgi:hypothetical protein